LGGTVNITTPNTILSQKGGLIVGTGAGSVQQLTVGADGTIPFADSTQTSGISWSGPHTITGKNKIFNGDFSLNQKGFVSDTSGYSFPFDRWFVYNVTGTATVSAQTFAAGNAIAGYEPKNFVRINTTGQSGNTAQTVLFQNIEDVRLFAGQQYTFSFWAKSASGTPKVSLEIQQRFGTNGAATNIIPASSVTIGTSWQRYYLTGTVPSISGKTITSDSSFHVGLVVSDGTSFYGGYTGIQNNTFDFWGIQMESGSSLTSFSTLGGNQQIETMLTSSSGFDGVLVSTNSSINSSGFGTNGWAGYQVAGKNHIIGGSMENWQRGITGLTSYTCDRFQVNTGTWSQSTDVPAGFTYSLSTATSPLSSWLVQHSVELPATGLGGPYTGLYTISFYAKFAAGSTIYWAAWFADGVGGGNQVAVSDYTGTTSPAKFVGTGTWTRYSYTLNIQATPSGTNKVLRLVWLDLTGTNLTGGFKMTGVQFEQGGTATAFARAGGTLDGELKACQRYYIKKQPNISDGYYGVMMVINSTTTALTNISLPSVMRARPLFSFANLTFLYGNNASVSISGLNNYSDQLAGTMGLYFNLASAATIGSVGFIYGQTASYMIFDAEI
jgi:hypothetical protein